MGSLVPRSSPLKNRCVVGLQVLRRSGNLADRFRHTMNSYGYSISLGAISLSGLITSRRICSTRIPASESEPPTVKSPPSPSQTTPSSSPRTVEITNGFLDCVLKIGWTDDSSVSLLPDTPNLVSFHRRSFHLSRHSPWDKRSNKMCSGFASSCAGR